MKSYSSILVYLMLLLVGCSKPEFSEINCSFNNVVIEKIWSNGRHNAFTTLIDYKGFYYCAFREGNSHVGDNGVIRIIFSSDLKTWDSYAVISYSGTDLRDPCFSITPDNDLMLSFGVRRLSGDDVIMSTGVSFMSSGFEVVQEMNFPTDVSENSKWLWRLTWHKGIGYGACYGDDSIFIVSTYDGINYNYITTLSSIKEQTEGRIRFMNDGTMVLLIRSGGEGYLGYSFPPYKDWKFKGVGKYLAGQDFVLLGDKVLCASRGAVINENKTVLYFGDVFSKSAFSKVYEFPSGGDCSYPGLVFKDDHLIVSYYSSHESELSSIYLAEMDITLSK